jgi:O-succinylbenzoate synthase
MGGVRPAVRVAAGCGLPVVVSSALDTSVGIAAGAALAAALPDLPYACGLGTVGLMATDVTAAPLAPDGGRLAVRAVSPDPDLLTALAAPPDRRTWWENRLRRCHARLAGPGP